MQNERDSVWQVNSPDDRALIASIAIAIDTAAAGSFLADSLPELVNLPHEQADLMFAHAVEFAAAESLDALVSHIVARYEQDRERQWQLLKSARDALTRQNASVPRDCARGVRHWPMRSYPTHRNGTRVTNRSNGPNSKRRRMTVGDPLTGATQPTGIARSGSIAVSPPANGLLVLTVQPPSHCREAVVFDRRPRRTSRSPCARTKPDPIG